MEYLSKTRSVMVLGLNLGFVRKPTSGLRAVRKPR